MASYSLKAMLPSLQSTKVLQEPILITENEGEKFFCASRGMIDTTCLYLRSDLSAAPPLGSFRRPCVGCN